jgi:hypothetical protein
MKRLILCIDNKPMYDNTDGYWKYNSSMVEAYAHIHSIPYKYHEIHEGVLGRHVSWSRIAAVLKYVDEYDEILCITSAVSILNHGVNVFDYLKTAKQSTLWKRNESVPPTIYTVSNKPHNPAHACTGIFLLDCTNKARAKHVMEDWWNDLPEKKYEKESPYEQSVWNLTWANDAAKASYLRVADIWTAQECEKDQVFIHLIDAYKNIRLNEARKYFYRMMHKRQQCKKRIGIFVRQQNYYTNGIGQNCIFILQSFEALGHPVDLLLSQVDASKPALVSSDIPYMYTNFDTVKPEDYCMFLFGASMPTEKQLERIRAAGVPTAVFNPNNPFDQFHNDAYLYKCRSATALPPEMMYTTITNDVWITDNHAENATAYLDTLNHKKLRLHTIPLSWSPLFTKHRGVVPMYKDRSNATKANILIMEPNLNYCKSSWLPLVIAERLYQDDPSCINKVYLFNAPESNPSAMNMIKSLQLHKDGKIGYYSRMPIHEILDFFVNKETEHKVVCLSHQTHMPMNYAYYDILYSGFPFVHNSSVLKEKSLGHYYDGVKVEQGVAALKAAIQTPRVEEQTAAAHAYIDTYDPYNPDVLRAFKAALPCYAPPAPKKPAIPDGDAPFVLTYDNELPASAQFYGETLKEHGWDYAIVGKGQQWTGWKGRAQAYKSVLETVDPTRLVVLTDARDVVCLRSSTTFKDAFASFKGNMIVSMELSAGGVIGAPPSEEKYNVTRLQQYWKHYGVILSERPYVNAGLICGYVHAILQYLNWFIESPHTDDQKALGEYMNLYPTRVIADTRAELLHTTNCGINGGAQDVQLQAKDSPSFSELCGRGAYFLHIPNGVSKGQSYVYEQVCKMLQSGINESSANALYKFKPLGWNAKSAVHAGPK